MSTGTCGPKLYARNNIFIKKNYEYEILNHLYFGPNFVFWRIALGRFSQCFFLIFRRRPTMVGKIFTQPTLLPPAYHKKVSYRPDSGKIYVQRLNIYSGTLMIQVKVI